MKGVLLLLIISLSLSFSFSFLKKLLCDCDKSRLATLGEADGSAVAVSVHGSSSPGVSGGAAAQTEAAGVDSPCAKSQHQKNKRCKYHTSMWLQK